MRGSRIVLPVALLLLIVSALLLYLNRTPSPEGQGSPKPGEEQLSSTGTADQGLTSPPSGLSAEKPAPSREAGFIDEGSRRREGQPRRRAPMLTVLAVDAGTDEPLAEAVVSLHRRVGGRHEFDEETTAADGTAQIEFWDPGSYYLSVRCEGYMIGGEAIRRDLGDGDLFRKIELVQGFTVRGSVRSRKGRPVGEAEVSFSLPDEPSVMVESGPDGTFSTVLTAGRYRVSASKDPYIPAEVYPVEIGPGHPQDIKILLEEPLEKVVLSGVVVDLQGRPVPRARISATDLSRRPAVRAGESVPSALLGVTAADLQGRFRLETAPRRRVLVEVEAHAFEPLQQTIGLEQDLQRDYRLKPYPAFSVRVVGAQGEDLPIRSGAGNSGLEVIGVNAAGQSVVGLVHRSGLSSPQSGKALFFASEYPFEIYAVDRIGDHGISERIQVGAFRPEITLVADQPAELRGYVSDPSGNPVSQFVVSYSSGVVQAARFFESEDGEFVFRRLPEGPCTIQVLSQEFEDFSTQLVLSRRAPSFVEAVVSRRGKPGM